jgi:transposase InsO family protein
VPPSLGRINGLLAYKVLATDKFRKQVEVMNIKEILSAPRSPWQRAYVERVIGSIRRECLDHVIVVGEESLRRTLRSYFAYYHRAASTCRWIGIHRVHDRYSPSAQSLRFRKSADFIIGTNVSPLE